MLYHLLVCSSVREEKKMYTNKLKVKYYQIRIEYCAIFFVYSMTTICTFQRCALFFFLYYLFCHLIVGTKQYSQNVWTKEKEKQIKQKNTKTEKNWRLNSKGLCICIVWYCAVSIHLQCEEKQKCSYWTCSYIL